MSDFDSPWREALDLFFELFLAFFFPRVHADIDWSRGYETLETELQQAAREAELGRHRADKLVKVWLRDGQEAWILIHVEVQSQHEAEFPRRMFTYNSRIFDLYNHPVVSLAVLGDDRASWRPDQFHYGRWGCEVGIRFPTVKLLDYAADVPVLEAHPNPFAALVLAHLKTLETRHDPETRRVWKVRLIKGLYERGLSKDQARQLFRLIDWLMDLPKPLARQFWQELQHYQQEKQMPHMTTTEQIWREDGEQEGMRKGLREGLVKAITLGLKLKFGPEALQLLPAIQAITEVDKLAAFCDAIETATSLEDLRRICS
jgi:hypothetical protein